MKQMQQVSALKASSPSSHAHDSACQAWLGQIQIEVSAHKIE